MAWNRYGYSWRPYVPVAQRRAKAQRKMASLRKKGVEIQPVNIEGRRIAKTFWGKAWCDHLESFSDYANRLPRGRTYVRNGSVCHLEINQGQVLAKVSGSELYSLRIDIKALPPKKWKDVKKRCSGQIGSLLELLQGKLSSHVMEVVTDRKNGLFPLPGEISLNCNCPDWATMCKHVAAVLYGVGARLDQQPDLLFKLRGVDHEELIAADAEAAVSTATSRGTSKRLAGDDLADVFGIDLDPREDTSTTAASRKTHTAKKASRAPRRKTATKKVAAKRNAEKKLVKKRSSKKGGAAKKVKKKNTAKKKVSTKKLAKKTVGKTAGKTKAKPTKKQQVAKKTPRKKTPRKKSSRKKSPRKPR